MTLIKNIPLPLCGLILALLSLGNLTQLAETYFWRHWLNIFNSYYSKNSFIPKHY